MTLNTTHSTINSSPDSQSQMKGLGATVFERSSMNPNISSEVNHELISGTINSRVRNGGLVISSR